MHEILSMSLISETAITKGRLVALGTADNTCTAVTAQGQAVFGIVNEEVTASNVTNGRHVKVTIAGVVKAKAGAVIAIGDFLTTTATGTVEPATTGDYICGQAIMGAANGDIFSMNFIPAPVISA